MAIQKEVVKKVAKKTVEKTGKAVNQTTSTAMGDSGKSLFFLIVSMTCFWLILDMFYGKKKITQLVDIIFGDGEPVSSNSDSVGGSDKTEENKKTEGKQTEENKNNSDKGFSGAKDRDEQVQNMYDKITQGV